MNLAVYGNGLSVLMMSRIMLTASQNVTITRIKCIYFLKLFVVYHFLVLKYPCSIKKKIFHRCYCMANPLEDIFLSSLASETFKNMEAKSKQ